MTAALTLRGVDKSFGRLSVLDGLDLDVPARALVAVLGPSGCGKSTLLRLVAGFDRPDAGTISLGGRTVAGNGRYLPPERRRVGMVPQDGVLFPHLSVAGNVGFGLPAGGRRAAGNSRVDEVLELVGLAGLGRRMPHELSGGQQQRVAVARALAPRPALVLLDEPFNALDAGLRTGLRADVRAALAADGATAVLVTHDQQEALSTADLVAVLRDGRVAQVAPPVDLYAAPADLGVATFVGDTVVLSGTAGVGEVRTVLGALPAKVAGYDDGAAVQVVLRPEQVEVRLAGAPDVEGADGVAGTVRERVYFGHDALLRVELAGGHTVTARCLDGAALAPGTPVRLAVRGQAVCFPPR